MNDIVNIAAYKFVTLDNLDQRREWLRELTSRLSLKGTILLSEEGINMFVAGTRVAIDEFLSEIRSTPELADLEVKESLSEDQPFGRMLVRLKKEIIAFGVDTIDPRAETSPRISAKELKQWLDEGRPVTLLDVRNDYEVELGTFRNAKVIGVDHFRDFPKAVEQLEPEMREAPVVTFCTGGIRCEKAGPFMEQAGFREVYQLDGGILKYFEECGDDHYDGECFVFDKRVALDAKLQETDTEQCFACLHPLGIDDQQSPTYVPGESCPYCFETPEQATNRRLEERTAQIAALTNPLPGSVPYENRRPMNVPGALDGVTVGEFLASSHTRLDEDQWHQVISNGQLHRRGEAVQTTDIVRAGDQLIHIQPDMTEPDVNARVTVLFEDEHLVAVQKPAPLPMHPSGRYNRNSLTHFLNTAYAPGRVRPLHRLDSNTSGVVLFARSRKSAYAVQPQFEQGTVCKHYLARVHGHPEAAVFKSEAPISDGPRKGGTREVEEDGLPAVTEFSVLTRYDDGTSLVEARPITGRTNQIRIHLANAGYPIVGDPSYGAEVDRGVGTLGIDAPPMCLHALRLEFEHPISRTRLTLEATTPEWVEESSS